MLLTLANLGDAFARLFRFVYTEVGIAFQFLTNIYFLHGSILTPKIVRWSVINVCKTEIATFIESLFNFVSGLLALAVAYLGGGCATAPSPPWD